MNSFQWDLRYAPATEVNGYREETNLDFSGSIDGPTIVPGAYTAVLQYGDRKLVAPVQVRLDPGLHPAAGDLDARLALEMRIHAALEKLDTMINSARAAERTDPKDEDARIESALADLVQFDTHSSEGDTLHETKLREHLAFLANEIEMAYAKPTSAEYAAFDELAAQADAGETRLAAVMSQR